MDIEQSPCYTGTKFEAKFYFGSNFEVEGNRTLNPKFVDMIFEETETKKRFYTTPYVSSELGFTKLPSAHKGLEKLK